MIVERISVQVKPGHRDQVVEMLKAQRAGLDDPSLMRILLANKGAQWNTVVYELTNASLADNEQRWQEWVGRAETPEFMQTWQQIVEDWSSEVWDIVED